MRFVLVFHICCVFAQYYCLRLVYVHSTNICVLCMCTVLLFVFETSVLVHSASNHLRDCVVDFTFCSESTEQNTARSTPNVSEWLRRKQRQHHSPPLVKLFEKGISKWTGAIFGILDVRLSLPEHTTYMHTHTHIIKSTTHIHHMNSALHTNTPYGGR